MRTTALPIAALVLAAGVSCGRSGDEARLSEDLERDLAAATTSSLELASIASSNQPMRFVSEIEQLPMTEPNARRPKPKPVVQNHTGNLPEEEKAPDPAPEPVLEQPQAPEPEQTVASNDAPRTPSVAPRPAPLPVGDAPEVASSGRTGAGRDEGPDLGTIIGVVIRGGGVGPGHCPPRRPPRRVGLPFPIPHQGAPVIRPIIHP